MPVLHVRALPQKDPDLMQSALKAACAAIAEAYGCKPNQVWATYEEIKPGSYVEGNLSAEVQPERTHPPIAELICFEGKTPQTVEKVLLAASHALSGGLGIPDNIFIRYVEARSGQVVAGNGVLRTR